MSADLSPKDVSSILDRAIVLCAKYVPAEHRNPTGSVPVLAVAVGLLVAARAAVEAVVEHETKGEP